MEMFNKAFIKKELMEYLKTSKFIILLVLFAFFAILSPLTARYINELLSMLSTDIPITLPEPTFLDAWVQYYKNMTSLCLIVFMIVMTGSIAQEKNKGSITLVLTKRVSRFDFIFSKFLVGSIIYSILLIVSLLISIGYTYILFDTFAYDGLVISLFLLWLMGIFYIALALLTSIISKTPTIAALLGFAGYALFNLINIASTLQKFNPSGASSLVNSILYGTSTNIDNWLCLGSTILGIIIVFMMGYRIFKKQEI